MIAMVGFGATAAALADDLKDKVKVEVQTAERHAGMEPGTYVCAAGHLHVKGSVENLGDVAVGQVKVAGKVFDANGKLVGTATGSTKESVLNPNDKANVDLEFLTVTGAAIEQVKKEQLAVIAVTPGAVTAGLDRQVRPSDFP
jgi:hypothetical protein